ncbi:transporter [Sphingomonas sp.]|uniref:transporter n=1 Tax=Sphingomonas sp. TaxID=28214 RepID=UPI003CC6C92D
MTKWTILAAALIAGPALAQTRDYCPERPGLNTPPCIIDVGHVSIETSLADWTLARQGGDREDTVLLGDTKLRIGLTGAVEAQIGWTPLGIDRTRSGGSVDRQTRVGDVTLGIKANLAHPDGNGFSMAILPFVTVPVGRQPIGAGDWGGGVLLPISYSIGDTLQLEATPEVDAAVDGDGAGRHLAYSATAGLGWKLTNALTLTGEGQVERDDDPAGHETHALAALSLAVQAGKNLQFDVFGAKGLNKQSPDVEIYGGVAARF